MAGISPVPFYYSLPKSEKIKSKKLLKQLFEQGKRLKSNQFHLQALWLSDLHLSSFLFAVAVSKRIFRSAVKRNRVKRVFRHAWQAIKADFTRYVPDGCAIALMFMAHKEISFHELLIEMRQVIHSFLEQYPAPSHA